jgi:hypothetical protein
VPLKSVRFDSIDQNNSIRLQRFNAAKHWRAIVARSDLARLQRSSDRHVHSFLRDVVGSQNFSLAFRRRAAVAAHGGNDEGLRAGRFQMLQNTGDNGGQIGDAPAADCDRDSGAGADSGLNFLKFQSDCVANIERRCLGKILAHWPHAREWIIRRHNEESLFLFRFAMASQQTTGWPLQGASCELSSYSNRMKPLPNAVCAPFSTSTAGGSQSTKAIDWVLVLDDAAKNYPSPGQASR